MHHSFEKKAFENKGIRVYILNLIENTTIEAINSILKFLEEPGQKVYAFLTTNNENAILPTIISRCQVLRLKLIDKKTVINTAIDEGVDKKEQLELLRRFRCDTIQGFYYSKPLTKADYEKFLVNNSFEKMEEIAQ